VKRWTDLLSQHSGAVLTELRTVSEPHSS